MRIVFASHTYMDPHLVVGSQHLAREFSRLGHSVLHLSCPITFAHLFLQKNPRYADRVQLWKEGKFHSPSLLESVPLSLIPWKLARPFITPSRNPYGWFLSNTRHLVRKHGFEQPDLLLVDDPRLMGIENWLRPRQLIYRATDFYARMKNDPVIDRIENWLAKKSDALIATSQPVLDHLQAHAPGKPSLLLENGVELDRFMRPTAPPPEYENIPVPRAVYVGALDERFDFEMTKTLAESAPDLQFFLVGPVTSPGSQCLEGLSNVHLVGQRPYQEIPGWLQHASLGLLPVNDHPANSGRSPMKLYEYAAAGLTVLSHATTEILRRRDPFVRLYTGPAEAVQEFRKILDHFPPREQNTAEALRHSWSARAETLLSFCRSIPSPAPHNR